METSKINFHKKATVISRVFAKKDFQELLKVLREASLTVEKINNGYIVYYTSKDGQNYLALKAMQGTNGYLTRLRDNLLI